MIGYAFIDKETNIVDCICSWGNDKIAEDYPIPDNQYVIELTEDVYNTFEQSVINGKRIKILNRDTLEFEEFIEEVAKVPTETEILQERLRLLEQAMNDMLLGGI